MILSHPRDLQTCDRTSFQQETHTVWVTTLGMWCSRNVPQVLWLRYVIHERHVVPVKDDCQSKLMSICLLYGCVKVCFSPPCIQYIQRSQEFHELGHCMCNLHVCVAKSWLLCPICLAPATFHLLSLHNHCSKGATKYFMVIIIGRQGHLHPIIILLNFSVCLLWKCCQRCVGTIDSTVPQILW